MENRIYSTMIAWEMAETIYNRFVVEQNCIVTGWEKRADKWYEKGQLVLDEIRKRDERDNMYMTKQGLKRKVKKWANSVGGHQAGKCFRFEKRVVNEEPRYTIWRVQ
jgi:hypothetical protein